MELSYYGMTKVRRTVNFSVELDGILGLLATKRQQNLSEFLEYTLRDVPEINEMILKSRIGSPQPTIKGSIPKPIKNNSEIPA
ncbi:MAG: hypothetical protein HZA82_07465 [Thaumarchaeota archaeon]|nr:hypothetical protein [Nitrososphaerota archaeon]